MKNLFAILVLCCYSLAQSPWPGQASNPVGYAAYGNGVVGGSACPGHASSGTAGNPIIIQNCTYSSAQTISTNFVWFIQVDFQSGTGGTNVSGSNDLFLGSRFQSNQIQFYNVQVTGANDTFLYDSVTPLTSFYSSPPGLVWPSAGSGANTTTQVDNTNAVAVNQGYQYGFNITSGGPVTIDHCDIWGFGNSIVYYSTTTQMNATNNWIHDAAQATGVTGGAYHTDGPGYLNGATGPNNVWMLGNTIASLGNTNGFAFQAATGGYSNIQTIENLFSGFGFTTSIGDIGTTHFTNSALLGNTYATDVQPIFGSLHGATLGANSVWACNLISYRSGTAWTVAGYTPASSDNGKFWVLNNGAPASATDQGSNTICALPNPSSLDFGGQPTSTTSATKSVIISCTSSAACTFSSIALTTGTQFAISSNNCSTGIASGANCTVNLTFTPNSQDVKSDTLVIASNNPAPANSLSVPLVGVGGLASAGVQTPTFSPVAGTYATTQTVTITSVTASATICYTTDGTSPTANGAGTCTHGTTLANGGTVSVASSITIQALGTLSGSTDSGIGSATYTIGTPVASLTPSSLSFGGINISNSSASQTLTLQNTGTAVMSITSISLTGANTGDFFQSNNCPVGSNLGNGASCTITVTFTPLAVGARSASVSVADGATGSPHTSTLSGTGVQASLASQINAGAKLSGRATVK